MSLTIHNASSANALFLEAASDFLRLLDVTLEHKPHFDVALSGGSTAKEFFRILAHTASGHRNIERIRFFFSDERVVPLANVDSNAGSALRLLLEPLSIDVSNFFPMYDGTRSAELSASSYENLLRNSLANDNSGLPVFDLIYLGLGQDGHTASLFPHSHLIRNIDNDKRLVVVTSEPHIAYERITLMPRLINNSKNICIMATGESKAKVVDNIINGPLMPESLPAQLVLRNVSGQVTLMTAKMGDVLKIT